MVSSIDVATAFLQSDPYSESDPKRYVTYKPHKAAPVEYYQLLGSIYGMRSGSMAWFKTLTKWLKQQGFESGADEPCVYTHKDTGLTVCCFVDDLLLRGTQQATEQFYKALEARFELKDPTYLTPNSHITYVGFDIRMELRDGVPWYTMDQHTAMKEFLAEKGVKPSKGISCPMPKAKDLYENSPLLDEEAAKEYRSSGAELLCSSNEVRYSTRYV